MGSLLGAYRNQDIIPHAHDGDVLVPRKIFDTLSDPTSLSRKALFEAGIHAWWDAAASMPRMCYHERAARLKGCIGSYGVCAARIDRYGSTMEFINDHEQTYVDIYSVTIPETLKIDDLNQTQAGRHVLHSDGRLR
jgi:hypothetical protein